MICAVLLPTRSRPDRLHLTLQSVYDTVADPSQIEVILRLDDDDGIMSGRIEEFAHYRNLKVLWGPRGRGYHDLHHMYEECANATEAKWLWVMNDDAVITGHGWDQQLQDLPTTGIIAQPELYQLGGSKYMNSEGGAFPLFAHGSWKPWWDHFQDNIDYAIDYLLRVQQGWKTHFLPGIGVVHARDNDEQLAEHRQLDQ